MNTLPSYIPLLTVATMVPQLEAILEILQIIVFDSLSVNLPDYFSKN